MTADPRRWHENLQSEIDGAAVYRAMAEKEKDASLAAVYLKLAVTEERHGEVWESKLRDAGAMPFAPRPTWRARILTSCSER